MASISSHIISYLLLFFFFFFFFFYNNFLFRHEIGCVGCVIVKRKSRTLQFVFLSLFFFFGGGGVNYTVKWVWSPNFYKIPSQSKLSWNTTLGFCHGVFRSRPLYKNHIWLLRINVFWITMSCYKLQIFCYETV